MGLDMTFYKRTYIDPKAERKEDGDLKYPSVRVQEYTDINRFKRQAKIVDDAVYVISQLKYFRKANAIHSFIVDRCWGEDGDPNCKWIEVSSDVLCELRDICEELLSIKDQKKFEEKAKEKLPTQSGFFFGPLDYDDYYRDCLKECVEMIDSIDLCDDRVDVVYRCWY